MIENDRQRELLARTKGMAVALATPLSDDGAVDSGGLERLVDRVIEAGASCVFVLGWMGEQPALTDPARCHVIDHVVQHVAGRVPVIAGVSEQSLPRSLEQALAAREAGADIILATPPFSYPLTPPLIADYFEQLSRQSGMPTIVYNNSEAHTPLDVDALRTLGQVPGIVGVKDFSNFVQLERLLANVHREGEYVVFAAEEYFLGPAMFLGAKYSMLGGPGNLVPGWVTRMHACADQGNWAEVASGHWRLIALCDELYGLADSPYSTVKAALGLLGYGCGACVPPLPALNDDQLQEVRAVLQRFEIDEAS